MQKGLLNSIILKSFFFYEESLFYHFIMYR